MMHYGQLVDSDKYQKYDFGASWSNTSHYGSSTPPLIPLNKNTGVPTAFFVGKHDSLGDPVDAKNTYSQL